jgi:predicted esterase
VSSPIDGWLDGIPGPHRGQPVLSSGSSLDAAGAAVILVHGRGASASGMLELASLLDLDGLIALAPQAAGSTWYPYRFLEPRERNEPQLSSALAAIGTLLDGLESAGIPAGRTALLGFSQGACLATDYAARNPRRYGALIGLSGGLIGDTIESGQFSGSVAGTPVFLGCSDVDPHIPVERVYETAVVFERLGGDVTTRIYPGMGHTINEDEIAHVQALLESFSRGNR